MKSQKVLYSKGKNDECYTPSVGVKPILKHIERYARLNKPKRGFLIVWCGFDKGYSEYVKQISELDNIIVVASHIDYEQDFFTYEPEEWDILVSNPPFSSTKLIFDRALGFNKPFALLSNLARMNDKNPMWCFFEAKRQPQLLKFDKRIEFMQNNSKTKGKITFQTGYICCDFLQRDLMLERLNK